MKKLAFLFLVLFPLIACSQKKNDQVLVLEKILNDKSISVFFEDKETIYLINNKNCISEKGIELEIGDKNVVVVDQDSTTQALKFIEYENTNKYIKIEIALFNNNVIYSATYRKINGKIEEIKKNTRFIKSLNN